MLDLKKIRLMTRASVYEKEEGVRDMSRNSFFASDYVRYCLLKNFLAVTLSAFLILVIYCLCNVEYVMTLVAEVNLGQFFRKVIFIYILAVCVYTGIGVIAYSVQYKASRDRLRKYYRLLKLIEKCGQEDR